MAIWHRAMKQVRALPEAHQLVARTALLLLAATAATREGTTPTPTRELFGSPIVAPLLPPAPLHVAPERAGIRTAAINIDVAVQAWPIDGSSQRVPRCSTAAQRVKTDDMAEGPSAKTDGTGPAPPASAGAWRFVAGSVALLFCAAAHIHFIPGYR